MGVCKREIPPGRRDLPGRLKVFDRVAAGAAAEGAPNADGDVVGNETSRTVAKDGLDAAGVTATGGKHRGRGGGGEQAGRVEGLRGIALATGIERIGNRAIGALVSRKHGSAAPPTKAAEV